MTECFEKTVTRINETIPSILAWAKGESRWLKNTLFICKNSVVIEYIDGEEGERFHEFVKNLTTKDFDIICEEFIEALSNKDLVKMHEGLAVFEELDCYPKLGNTTIRRRLMRIRKSTEEKSYNISLKEDRTKDFIIYQGRVYK